MKPSIVFVALAATLMGPGLAALASSAPIALDDHVESDGGTAHIYVLANDSGDIDQSTLSLVTPPSQGEARVIATGSPRIKYTSWQGGADTFTYSICSADGVCATATVTVNSPSSTTTTSTSTTTTTPATTTPATVTTQAIAPPPPTSAPATSTPATTTATSPVATAAPQATTTTATDPLLDVLLSTEETLPSGTVGEPRGFDLSEDLNFIGRSGGDTLKLVAVPAVMVSGILGFLLLGLPQNLVGSLLGFLVGFRRRNKGTEAKDKGPKHLRSESRQSVGRL